MTHLILFLHWSSSVSQLASLDLSSVISDSRVFSCCRTISFSSSIEPRALIAYEQKNIEKKNFYKKRKRKKLKYNIDIWIL